MTCTSEHEFIVRVERLVAELRHAPAADPDLQRRWHDALMEGYGRALALEGERRRLRKRQLELADLPQLDQVELRELAALARREAQLVRRERELRVLLEPLRERERHSSTGRVRK